MKRLVFIFMLFVLGFVPLNSTPALSTYLPVASCDATCVGTVKIPDLYTSTRERHDRVHPYILSSKNSGQDLFYIPVMTAVSVLPEEQRVAAAGQRNLPGKKRQRRYTHSTQTRNITKVPP